ncbi:hypothetical protein AB1L30_13755 [Bremerella sp. JC817]|uniref:hypothetical protein n=1 Tax=Bremerella sp. JC817 TaxID=3231756 RepID=UPI00345903C3
MRCDRKKAALSVALTWMMVAMLQAGCGQHDWQARTFPTRGTITINGEPPEQAFIKLIKLGEPVDERESDCWALVQADGTYEFSTYESGDGCPPGEYAWILRWPANLATMMPDRLGEKYWNQDDPYMTVTIVRGQNDLPAVELTGVAVKPLSKPASKVEPR